MENKKAEQQNQQFWDEVAPVHFNSYDLQSLRTGRSLIDEVQKKELYPIEGKSLLHLQCHIGSDSISLAMDGAEVTGIDFSEKSVALAKQLNEELGASVQFLQGNVLDCIGKIDQQFDIVYTSQGVLGWLNDLNKWATTVAHYLKDGGTFYIQETHPVLYMVDDDTKEGVKLTYPYFHSKEPMRWGEGPDYSDKTYISKNHTFEWTWSMSDIVNALIKQGLQIQFINEYDKLFYQALDSMEKRADGWWYLPGHEQKVPLMFTLKAVKT